MSPGAVPLDDDDRALLMRLAAKWSKKHQQMVSRILDGVSTELERDEVSDLVFDAFSGSGLNRNWEPNDFGKSADKLAGRLFSDDGWSGE